MKEDKYRYTIFPERTYVIDYDGDKVQVSGSDIVNIVPDILRKKYIEAFFRYEEVPFDNTQEGLVE
jgi:hypothetical protein